ncbi:SEC-C metal-binding domain-containing protein [Klebsiella pneumoniae]
MIESLHQTRDTSRFSLLIQIYIKLNDVITLIGLSGEELFYEMGITVDIMASLKEATASESMEPIHKFWALDGLVFSQLKDGASEQMAQLLEAMEALLTEHEFGYQERAAYTIKQMIFLSEKGDLSEVQRLADEARPGIPDEEHARIFDYTYAIALWKLKRYKQAETLCQSVVKRYYELFGITPLDVMGKNSDVLWTIINHPENVHEHIKHLADALELLAHINDAQGKVSPFLRIHAMKFYNMTAAPESLVRVGQDLADEFVARKDYVGAREVMEQHVLPVVNTAGLVQRLVQVRSQYAVILALAGEHKQAEAEMRRLEPYFEGLTGDQRQEVEDQSTIIAHLAYKAAQSKITKYLGPVGRNEPCPCGSGKKYKKCHG